MKIRSSVIAVSFAASIFAASAMAAGSIAKFDGGIGVDPVGGIATATGLPVSKPIFYELFR